MKKKNRTKAGKKRFRFFRFLARILAILLVLVIGVGAAVFFYADYTKTHYAITFYQKTSPKLRGNVRLAVISDIHNREYGEGNAVLIDDLSALKPDLILFLGDMITKTDDHYEPMLNLVKTTGGYNGVPYNNPGPAHLSAGQEAAAVGMAYNLDTDD